MRTNRLSTQSQSWPICRSDTTRPFPETQAEFLWGLGDSLPGSFGPERSQHLMPLATYRKSGMIFASGSDYPVTPLPARYGLWASVAREPMKGTYGPHPFGTDEAIDVHTAL